jgi:hypothetical protein
MKKTLLPFALAIALTAIAPASPMAVAATVTVPAGADLQAALNAAAPGDTIVLAAGATYTGTFVLPVKSGNATITITSSGTLPASGTRVTPANAPQMARIIARDQSFALATAPGAHDYRLVGLEISVTPGFPFSYGLLGLGDVGAAQDTVDEVPTRISVERCYIHGTSTANTSRAIALNSSATTVVDCYLSECHDSTADAQAICGWNGPGPFTIQNNYIEASGENVLFGGADPSIPNLVPSDITFRQNLCSRPLSWRAGSPHWVVKNIFELKNARRVTVDGNIFENNWADGQNGCSILFTPRNQFGTAPWTVVEDVTFTNNIVRHVAAGVNILGQDDQNASLPTRRITIRNNLFDDVSSARYGGPGRFLQTIGGPLEVTIDRNTVMQDANVTMADGAPTQGCVITGNIVNHNAYGVIGTGTGIGNPTLARYYPASIFTGNVLIGGTASFYPSGNFFPGTVADVGFVDPTNGDYHLTSGSQYTNSGAQIDQINSAINGGGSGPPPPPPPPPPPTDNQAPVVVNWTNLVNARVANGTLWKSVNGWAYDSGASSSQSIVGDGYLEFTVHEVASERYVGIDYADGSTSPNEIAYAFRLAPMGGVEIYEGGRRVATAAAAYVPGDVFRVAVSSGAVNYYIDGTLVYTSSRSVSGAPLTADVTFYQAGGTLANAMMLQ